MMSLYFFTKIDVFIHSNIQNQYNCWKTFFALNKAKYTIIVSMLKPLLQQQRFVWWRRVDPNSGTAYGE